MCTAISYTNGGHFFGRTLDYHISFGQQVVVMPRNFSQRCADNPHFAVCGMATVAYNYPLFFDGMNEKGLCMAGLNFVGNAVYSKPRENAVNIAQFELIPILLSSCADTKEAVMLLKNSVITDRAFSKNYPPAPLHWLIADSHECITVEAVKSGLRIYQNRVGVLTNNPTFDKQLENLGRYSHLTPDSPEGESLGLGAVGLPGDLSSRSRFVRAVFMKNNSVSSDGLNQFFHIADTVKQIRGCCRIGKDMEYTRYTCCCEAERGIYHYKTYDSAEIKSVDMNRVNLNSTSLHLFGY